MARKSYDRMYREYDVKEFDNKVEEPTIEEVVEEIIPEKKEDVVKEVKEVKKVKSITGTVIGGAKLNVRKNPGGEVVDSINDKSQVVIVDESDPEWYKIDSPAKGYVMKKFVSINK